MSFSMSPSLANVGEFLHKHDFSPLTALTAHIQSPQEDLEIFLGNMQQGRAWVKTECPHLQVRHSGGQFL